MQVFKLISLMICVLASLTLALAFGPAAISVADIYQCISGICPNSLTDTILWQIRVPRVLAGFAAGAGLALAGAVLQNSTRNPLADPYLFGIVAGAGLGATLATVIGIEHSVSLPLAAFAGATFSVLCVFFLSAFVQRIEQLLLAGVALSFMLGALSQFILYVGEPLAANRVMFWLMGSLSRVSLSQATLMLAVISIAFVAIAAVHRHLDAMALGDESAATLGVNVNKVRLILLMLCASLTAVIVAYCGGIAFVGLMIPHIARQVVGNKSLKLISITALLGGCFLVWLDVIARSAIAHLEIPIGILTSAIGSLFFLMVMYRGHRQYG